MPTAEEAETDPMMLTGDADFEAVATNLSPVERSVSKQFMMS